MSPQPTDLTRARRGARLLDRVYGRRWRRWIRRRELNMREGVYGGPGDCGCILAQIDLHLHPDSGWGSYSRQLDALGIDNITREMAYGFSGDMEDDAWLQVLREGAKT